VALLSVLTLGALPAVEVVGVVHGAGHNEALELHPANVADGAREEDVRLSLHTKLLVGLRYTYQNPPRLLWLLA
jgi:hypothetical protein